MPTFKIVQGFETAANEEKERYYYNGFVARAKALSSTFKVLSHNVVVPDRKITAIGETAPFEVVRITHLSVHTNLPRYFKYAGHLVVETTGSKEVIIKDILQPQQ